MLFNSLLFLVFFLLVTSGYYLLPKSTRWIWLLAASCYFYMYFKPEYILIILFTIVVDYIAGILIEKAEGRVRKVFLLASIITNVGVLAFYKYFNFFAENINHFSGHFNGPQIKLLNFILPIGLSFHTFQAMSYTIEVYKGNQKAERHFGLYALYVMFYPQMVAGPIERPQQLLPQLKKLKPFNNKTFVSGIFLMLVGLFKKAVVADRLGLYVDPVFSNPRGHSALDLLLATYFFAFQIYCDFSGYTDIAIGAALTLGVELIRNFNMPYLSVNISEFWKRWHISLSTWFRDYVYIPLGGNRVSKFMWGRNILIVFVLSGAWHGANWTFLIWGLLHGVFMIGERSFGNNKRTHHRPLGWPAIFLRRLWVFSLVTFAWIFFRSQNLRHANWIVRHLFVGIPGQVREIAANLHFARLRLLYLGQSLNELIIALAVLGLLMSIQFAQHDQPIDKWLEARPRLLRWTFYYGIPLTFISLGIFNRSEFIYFQF